MQLITLVSALSILLTLTAAKPIAHAPGISHQAETTKQKPVFELLTTNDSCFLQIHGLDCHEMAEIELDKRPEMREWDMGGHYAQPDQHCLRGRQGWESGV
ncbi:MAG: hypothetical protein Q9169_008291 [Polycauliona sp. 2 TL-2023]